MPMPTTVKQLKDFLATIPEDVELYQQTQPMDLSRIGYNKKTKRMNFRGTYI